MTRVVIRFKDGEHMNIPADCIDIRDGWIFAWKGDPRRMRLFLAT